MDVNYLALLIGIALSAFLIARFSSARLLKAKLLYSILLSSFPLYYFVFAIYAVDSKALINEVYAGIVFILIAYTACRLRYVAGFYVLSIGYLGHAVYDFAHSDLFTNLGTPDWWPEFCGTVDGILGLYLLSLAFVVTRKKLILE